MNPAFYAVIAALSFINCGASAHARDYWSAGWLLLIGAGFLHMAMTKGARRG